MERQQANRSAAITLLVALALIAMAGSGQGTALPWAWAAMNLLAFGFIPALAHALLVGIAMPHLPERKASLLVGPDVFTVLALALAAGFLLQPSVAFTSVAIVAGAGLVAIAVLRTRFALQALPGRGESVVDEERDPLTKGDDACVKQLRMAHIFYPLGMILAWTAMLPYLSFQWGAMWRAVAGLHLVTIGYGLLVLYGAGHVAIPRYSGVPAIAAGAIKGELHSTLLGLVLLVVGLATDLSGLAILGGGFVFVGFFTYMGVLGANIMRNKSPTGRVTPEFVYVPWTFTGVFWLVWGVVMGLLLAAEPPATAAWRQGIILSHVVITILGGAGNLWLGWRTRQEAMDAGVPPPPFAGGIKGGFVIWNAGVAAAAIAAVGTNAVPWLGVSALAMGLGFLWYSWSLKGIKAATGSARSP